MSGVPGTNPQVHDFDKIYDYKTLEDFGYVFHNGIYIYIWPRFSKLKIKTRNQLFKVDGYPGWHLLSSKPKMEARVWNFFKVNKDTRTTSLTSFRCLYCQLLADSTYCSDVSIADFKKVKTNWRLASVCICDKCLCYFSELRELSFKLIWKERSDILVSSLSETKFYYSANKVIKFY